MTIQKFGSATLQEITKIEKQYKVKLPNDYVKFLKEFNGGVIEKNDQNKVFIKDISAYIHVDVLYGLQTGSRTSDIETWMNKFEDDLLEHAMIIGDDLMQGFIVLICEGEFEGVYYWDDSYQFDESTDEENTYWIADSFSSFVKQLI
ncbi:SMI1/KNR4 family protein [Bhargavaea beijingensis]|uniref:SMI1/KNR4 family protein n=1 Tax=Bhargavaea beijingensis TaxID=426756 RepID=A0ABX9ZD70_9BACL|nr:SMI1/KNR4 family protein [Bhargavaea beijingensis]MCW1927802.1 SMI1/KNR4 family protein [Bhargavaea beijingensis]RSK31952.1 SMI1/KNR4 family protein [Bhargavaea beijingensis]